MVLARSVPNPKAPRHILLKAGYQLDEESIDRLRSLHVYSIWIRYPSLDFLDELLDPELIQQQQELYAALKEQFTLNQEESGAKLDYSQYVSRIGNLFQRILCSDGKTSMLINELQGEANDIFQHCTTVAFLSLLIGMRLENYLIQERTHISTHLAVNLTSLGVGALLHDIGKLALPEELRAFHLTAQDRGDPIWQSHTEAGFDMIKDHLDPSAAKIALDHHQHFDGSGFPLRKAPTGFTEKLFPLQGKEIHIFCRIATLADRYENFRHLPNDCVAPAVVALHRIHNPGYTKWFDPVVFKAFIESVPPFAPGEQVVLNNNQQVVITELNEKFPYRPIVRPIDLSLAAFQENSNPASVTEDGDIDLSSRLDLQIAQVGNFEMAEYLLQA